jgi:hypothetical protein
MYDLQRQLAEEHQADLIHEAERRHLVSLAGRSAVGRFLRGMTHRARSHRSR